jgi:hypothetical protein
MVHTVACAELGSSAVKVTGVRWFTSIRFRGCLHSVSIVRAGETRPNHFIEVCQNLGVFNPFLTRDQR